MTPFPLKTAEVPAGRPLVDFPSSWSSDGRSFGNEDGVVTSMGRYAFSVGESALSASVVFCSRYLASKFIALWLSDVQVVKVLIVDFAFA